MKVIYMTPELEKEIYGDVKPYSEKGFKLFEQWTVINNVYCYSAIGENFDANVGISMATLCGCDAVLMEDLS
jgi:hypothetical protein